MAETAMPPALLCDRCPLTALPFPKKIKKAGRASFLWPLCDSLYLFQESSNPEPESGLLTVSLPAISFPVCLCSVLTANTLGFFDEVSRMFQVLEGKDYLFLAHVGISHVLFQ